jgi:protein CpxP
MKLAFFTALLATGLAASPAVAQQSPHQHGTSAAAQAQPGQGGMMQGGMMQASAAMQAHRQKMQEMQVLMQKAHATTNPAERQRLIVEHREMMQAQMGTMMRDDNAAMMQACQERMAMMHDMMAQMAAEQEMMPAK